MNENEIGDVLIETAIQVHRSIGPGLMESVYEALAKKGLEVSRQVIVPIEFDRARFVEGFRADLIVENKVIVELKCVETIHEAHKKQLLTYLRLSGIRLGYLLNFSEALMKHGIHRTVNRLPE
jgi:GxxExxY protein